MAEVVYFFRLEPTVPDPLIIETRRVVSHAMRLLEWGEVSDDDQRFSTVINYSTWRMFSLLDIQVDVDQDVRYVSTGSTHAGLFIHGFQLDLSGKAIGELQGLQLPRNINAVNRLTLLSYPLGMPLNEISYVQMRTLADDLNTASIVNSNEYVKIAEQYYLKRFQGSEIVKDMEKYKQSLGTL